MPPPEDEASAQPTTTEDTATTEAAPEAQETPAETQETAVDYQKRYEDLRPEYDRNQQRLSQYEQLVDHLQDPEHQAAALEALGLQLAEEERDEEDADYIDPDDRIEQIESFLEQRLAYEQAQAQEEEMLDKVEDRVDALEAEHGEFSEKELNLILGYAEANPDEDGIPDIEGGHELLLEVSEARREKYLSSKKGSKPPVGQAAVEDHDLDDDDERVKALADMLEAEETTGT